MTRSQLHAAFKCLLCKCTENWRLESCDRMDKQFEPRLADEEVQRAKGKFVGAILQQPPMYSAVSIKGERLYRAARRGGFLSGLVCQHAR